ncbi:hypothetical protein LTR67_003963 [Exophiala xenobiotica]
MSLIPLQQMVQVANVHASDEDWTGLTSPAERRKLQNRLNKRASRKRKVIQDIQTGVVRRRRGRQPKNVDSVACDASSSSGSNSTANCEANDAVIVAWQDRRRVVRPGVIFYICEVNAPDTMRFVSRLAAQIHQTVESGLNPSADLLLSLTQFNVLRAMLKNLSALGVSMADIKGDNISSFNHAEGVTPSSMSLLPPALRPTALQQSIIHHPWIDPFPIPSFRDTLLLADGIYDEVALCNDMVGQCGDWSSSQVGIIIWGEPWDPYGWEMTECFSRKWLWLFRGCRELLKSTNYWRAQRGEGRLFEI